MEKIKMREASAEDIAAFVAEYQAKAKMEGRITANAVLLRDYAEAQLACQMRGCLDEKGFLRRRVTDEDKFAFGKMVIARNRLKAAEASVARAAVRIARVTASSPTPAVPPHIAAIRTRAAELGRITPPGAHDLMSKALAAGWSDERYRTEVAAWRIINAGRTAQGG